MRWTNVLKKYAGTCTITDIDTKDAKFEDHLIMEVFDEDGLVSVLDTDEMILTYVNIEDIESVSVDVTMDKELQQLLVDMNDSYRKGVSDFLKWIKDVNRNKFDSYVELLEDMFDDDDDVKQLLKEVYAGDKVSSRNQDKYDDDDKPSRFSGLLFSAFKKGE